MTTVISQIVILPAVILMIVIPMIVLLLIVILPIVILMIVAQLSVIILNVVAPCLLHGEIGRKLVLLHQCKKYFQLQKPLAYGSYSYFCKLV
jgi:hypothetical protein